MNIIRITFEYQIETDMKENQLRVTIKDSLGREFKITYRSSRFQHPDDLVHVLSKQSSSVTLHTKVGDNAYWHDSDMYMTKRSGVVTEAIPLIWDYSMPIGDRARFISDRDQYIMFL